MTRRRENATPLLESIMTHLIDKPVHWQGCVLIPEWLGELLGLLTNMKMLDLPNSNFFNVLLIKKT